MLSLVPVFRLCLGDSDFLLVSESFFGQWFVGLTFFVIGVRGMCEGSGWVPRGYFLSFRRLGILLLFSFSVSRGFFFFFLFEGCLIPISFMILSGGTRPERIQAVGYMVLYTVLGGAFHLMAVTLLYVWRGRTTFCTVDQLGRGVMGFMWGTCLFFCFFVKCPLYGVHFWLPKAHVEASTTGSMLLAAVMLKLGVYGVFRFSSVALIKEGWGVVWQTLGLGGGVLASIISLRQPDLKSVIAYASVAHMSLAVSAVLMFTPGGRFAALTLRVAHGLRSRGLFFWAG